MSERWEQIERLYHAAVEREPSARAAFLAEACAGDEDLRREVASLLAYDNQPASFIEAPALEVVAKKLAGESLFAAPTKPPTNAPSQIGAYQILSLLGRGGMGEVWLAHDPRLGRQVAIKLLPAEFTQDAERVRRFEQEARLHRSTIRTSSRFTRSEKSRASVIWSPSTSRGRRCGSASSTRRSGG